MISLTSGKLKLKAVPAPWWNGVEFLLRDKDSVAVEVVMRTLEDSTTAIEPTFRLEMNMAQELMDDLWACGIRPSQGVDNAGQLRATENHLKDMQQLVYRLLPRVMGE